MTAAHQTPVYDGAPRPITGPEAFELAREEYTLRSQYGQHHVYSRGSDGGMHLRETFSRSQAAIVWMNTRRQDLVRRIMAGEATHTVFFDRARDRYWIG